ADEAQAVPRYRPESESGGRYGTVQDCDVGSSAQDHLFLGGYESPHEAKPHSRISHGSLIHQRNADIFEHGRRQADRKVAAHILRYGEQVFLDPACLFEELLRLLKQTNSHVGHRYAATVSMEKTN